MNKLFIFLFFIFLINPCISQTVDRYSLLTERYIDRPLAMYKGQLQFNTGYEFSIISKKYDPVGKKIDLAKEGSVTASHLFPFVIRFGILDYIQISASTNYASMGVRSQSITYGSLGANLYQSEISRYKGFDDLYLGLDFSAPFKSSLISWVLTGGIHLPVFSHEPDKPSHIYKVLDQTSGSADLVYKYNKKFGTGIPVSVLGSSIKLRLSKVSFTGSFHYLGGMKEGESTDWDFRLVNNQFEYEKQTYHFHPGNQISYFGELALQTISWFTVIGSFGGYQLSGGWSDVSGKKVSYFDESLCQLSIGYEILVSPLLRIEQHTILPLSGKNVNGQWIFDIGISFNFISASYNSLN